MPILGTIASSYLQATATAAYESIYSNQITSNTSEITWNSIPSTFTHLQIRMWWFANSYTAGGPQVQFNGDTGSNYALQSYYWGYNGSSGGTGNCDNAINQTYMRLGNTSIQGYTIGSAPIITNIDILDYRNTSKWKHAMSYWGTEATSGTIKSEGGIYNGIWRNTSAVTSIRVFFEFNCQYGYFGLYGVKG